MTRLPFIPARSSRHRAAVLSLYRALLRSAKQLPNDTKDAAHALVRRQMDKHRAYTSPRLIYSSIASGYKVRTPHVASATDAKFLSVADEPLRSEITQHLRSCRPRPPSLPPKHIPAEPLLINTSPRGHAPVYKSSKLPRPKSAVGKTRRVPRLCTTADGQPFLRMCKPQSPQLSKLVGRKGRIFTSKILRLVEIDEELTHEAILEDEWEALVAAQMTKEGRTPEGGGGSHRWSVQLSRLWWEWQIERTWQDWVARGEALNELVEKERALSMQERGEARQGHIRTEVRFRPNVAVHPAPPLPLTAAVQARLKEVVHDTVDPFLSRTWRAVVDSETPRMMKWIGRDSR